MRSLLITISILMMTATLRAAPDDHRPHIAAAASSARDHLFTDLQSEHITPSLTVGDYLTRTNSQQRIIALLQHARQIGGPRWLDDQTCQVRLDLPGRWVKLELWHIAVDHPNDPLTPDDLSRDLHDWEFRIFSATGTSTARLDAIRPPAGSSAWAGATDQDIRAAIAAARQDAAQHILESIATVPLARGATLAEALSIPQVRQAMTDWLNQCPVTLVDFQEDHRVRLALAVTATDLCGELRSVLTGRTDMPLPADDLAWSAVQDHIERQMAASVGDAKANIAPTTRQTANQLPEQAPDWASRRLVAAAQGSSDSALMAARSAEAVAIQSLHDQVARLPVGQGKFLGDLAAKNPDLAAAIARAVNRNAHLDTVEYISDTQATVHVFLDLRDLWDAIRRQ